MFGGIIVTNMRGSASLTDKIRRDRTADRSACPRGCPDIDLDLPDQVSMFLGEKRKEGSLIVGVVRLQRIANFTDFDALSLEPGVVVRFLDGASEVSSLRRIDYPWYEEYHR